MTFDSARCGHYYCCNSFVFGRVVVDCYQNRWYDVATFALVVNQCVICKFGTNFATIINGVTSTYISGDYIYIGNESATTVISGKASISQLETVDAKITNLINGTTLAGSIRANQLSAGSFSLGGHSHNNSNITIDGVTYNIVTWTS